MPKWNYCNKCDTYRSCNRLYERRFGLDDKSGKFIAIGWRCRRCEHIEIDEEEKRKKLVGGGVLKKGI